MRAVGFLATLLLSAAAFSAPHADPKLVDLWSRMDEFHGARGVERPAAPRELKKASPEPDLGLDAFMDANQNTGLLVLKGDTILGERYQYGRTGQERFASASMAKTILAMLVGIAVEEKKISSIDDVASKYLPELRGHAYGDTPIRHLLTMSSGMKFSEPKLVANAVRRQSDGGVGTIREFDTREAPPGMLFHYSSPDSQVLGLVLRHALKAPLADYLAEKIWRPMGAEAHATWIVDKAGFEIGFCCLNARVRDYARFGMLLANYGKVDGRQVIPEAWVRAATKADGMHLEVGAATRNNGYGYQTWVLGDKERKPRGAFAALGFGGQALFVDPKTQLVIVHTAAWTDGNDRAARGRQFRFFEEVLSKLEQQ